MAAFKNTLSVLKKQSGRQIVKWYKSLSSNKGRSCIVVLLIIVTFKSVDQNLKIPTFIRNLDAVRLMEAISPDASMQTGRV